jgi:hypothetical protein
MKRKIRNKHQLEGRINMARTEENDDLKNKVITAAENS